MSTYEVVVSSRVRRLRFVSAAINVVAFFSPVLRRRLSWWIAARVVRLVRVDYRLNDGVWRPMALRFKVRP